jgi:hypothetical protein
MTTVWVYFHGDGSVTIFATELAALRWFSVYDPEGVAFEHKVVS